MELPLITRNDLPDNAFTVSRSRLSTWMTCQQKHFYTYEAGIPRDFDDKRSTSMNLGVAIHLHLQHFYNLWLQRSVGEASSEQLDNIHAKIFLLAKDRYQKTHALRAAGLLNRYADWAQQEDDFIPLGTEVEIFADTGMVTPDDRPIFLHGIIDLFFELYGDFGFMDHKSGAKFWTPGNAYFDPQMLFYNLIFKLNGFDCKYSFINNINNYDYKKLGSVQAEKLFSRVPVDNRAMQLDEYYRNVKQTIKQILNLKTVVMNTDKHCEFCRFKYVCEARLKNIPTDALLDRVAMRDIEVEFTYG